VLKNQYRGGFVIENTIASGRGPGSVNRVPAGIRMRRLAHSVLIDGELRGRRPFDSALSFDFGSCYARNVRTSGYACAVSYYGRVEVPGAEIGEYCSHPGASLFGERPSSLGLPIEEAPDVPWPADPNQWVSVNRFGAAGDGKTDDTEAIRRAMASGCPVIYFQPGKYVIDAPIEIPATVERVNFMFADLIAGPNLREMRDTGTFVVTGETDRPLILEDLFAWEEYYGYQHLIDHASVRPLILSDLHVQAGPLYRNSVPGGKVFIENICCTTGSLTEDKMPYGVVPCLEFRGQTVWARQLNPERSLQEVVNRGSMLWVLGFKTEGYGSAYVTTDGGSTEVLGGVISIGGNRGIPAIVNDESNVSIVASTNGYSHEEYFPIAVRETRGGETRELRNSGFPVRFVCQYTIPLYSGRSRN